MICLLFTLSLEPQHPGLHSKPECRPCPQLWPCYEDTGLLPEEQAAVSGPCRTLGSVTET